MKKNNERILKYLSYLMTGEERIRFEEELKNSAGLKNELDDTLLKLSELKNRSESEVNELYFADLIPRTHQKLEKRKSFWRIANLYYLVPTAAAVVVLFLFLFNSKRSFESQYKELANEVVNNISDKEVSEKYLTEIESDPSDILLTNNSDEFNIQIPSDIEVNNDSYIRLIGNPITEEYSTIQKLSDNELERVYNKLSLSSEQEAIK